jgi:amidohydrolase
MSIATQWQEQLDAAVDRRFEEMVSIRRHLHSHPELSGQEHETSLFLYQQLDADGHSVELGPEGRGVVADPKQTSSSQTETRRICIRADIDALAIQDEKNAPYASQVPSVMHACGHDAHTATVLSAIRTLAELEVSGDLPWPVCWRAVFQPSEETCEGAHAMVRLGVLKGVDAIIATHMDPTQSIGKIGVRPGVLTANGDMIVFTIYGRGGHAARPHETIDPIAVAAQLISSLYLFVPRTTDSLDAVVITIGQILGGDNPNVIPEKVQLKGTLRTLSRLVRERTLDYIRQLARGVGESTGTKIDVEFSVGVHSVQNDLQLTDLFRTSAAEVLGVDGVEEIPRPSMGGEDFSAYLDHVPGAMFRLGCASPGVESTPLHTPRFDIDEKALAIGAKVLARTAVLWSRP